MLRHRFEPPPVEFAPPPPPVAVDSVEMRIEAAPPAPAAPDMAPLPERLVQLKERVHQRLVDEIDQERLAGMSPEQARRLLQDAAAEILAEEDRRRTGPEAAQFQERRVSGDLRPRVLEEVIDEVLGLGPLEALLRDDTITEIMVNAPDQVWVERGGRLYKAPQKFRDEAHVQHIVERIVRPLGRHVDEASPTVDARLPDGSRVNIIVPPAAPKGAKITLRKFARRRLGVDELLALGTVTPEAAAFLKAAVQGKLNILVSGGTGSGKTTLLNVLSSFIADDERIVTIEDPMELQLQQSHVVSLEAQPLSNEGTRQVTQRELVRNALRMRPDRIIVGEVRGSEAFDMLQAMNTGHEGSISTVHANAPREALSRVENMVLMAGFDLPIRAVREQVASAIHLIVQVGRLADGTRRLTHITEVLGMEEQTITLQDIFLFEAAGRDETGRVLGSLAATGMRPHYIERLERQGVRLAADVYRSDRWR